MKQKKTKIGIAFLLVGLGSLQAQDSPTAAGGDATGTGGTVSYSVGQVFYTTQTGANENVTQGVQQSYEISATTDINESAVKFDISIYPNPTANFLTLKIENTDNLSYQLFDINGKLIESKTVSNNSSNISLENQPPSTYFLKVTQDNLLIKTFKITKN